MTTTATTTIGILGSGAWGTALAVVARRAGSAATIWAREDEVADAINRDHENRVFLPGHDLDPAIVATTRFEDLADVDLLLLTVPAQYLRGVLAQALPALSSKEQPLVICSKGIEQESLALMSEVVADIAPDRPLAVLSGPTFAAEVASGQPTAVTVASRDANVARRVVEALGSLSFRPYVSSDVVGAQIGGAVKNVIAIAAGIAAGRGFGANAAAALVTRGLAEMNRLGRALGARTETLMGLSGLGDLVLTCGSHQSRNMSLGYALGEGRTLAEIQAGRRTVAEGVASAASVAALARRLGVEMPITEAVEAVLYRDADVAEQIEAILARPFRDEGH